MSNSQYQTVDGGYQGLSGKNGKILVKGYKLSVISHINSRYLRHSMVTIVNNRNLLRDLKCLKL